jgi:hypothetical protein
VFVGRTILEIQAADPVLAMRALDGMPGVEKTSVFGTAVHAVVRDGQQEAAARLESQLTAQHLDVRSIAPVPPSLEDVFLDVVTEAR